MDLDALKKDARPLVAEAGYVGSMEEDRDAQLLGAIQAPKVENCV